ncbi:MAG: aminopeptidase P family protein [Clostridia bacterium]|nr:aminopeptidase P family protein [Clostridia bacterium]
MNRVERFRLAAALKQNEGVIIHKPSNIYYLSGYTGEGLLVIGTSFAAVVTDFRYTEQCERQAPDCQCLMVGQGLGHVQIAYNLFKDHGIDTVRFEDDKVTVQAFEGIKAAMPDMTFVSLNRAPENMRIVKDEEEISYIEEACRISCAAFEDILTFVKPGMTEKQVQLHLDFKMLELGAEGHAFSTIAAAGENGSLPHAIPSDRVINVGDMITLDFGAKKHGYCADMTRTFAVGAPSDEMKKIYYTVLQAQMECQEMLSPGICCKDVDSHARKIIDGAGYEGRFGHGLGHGVGIDIHEAPRLSQACTDLLVPGHVVTVEPGIYIPGLGGVRIENTCAITKDGYRSLVHAERELIIL